MHRLLDTCILVAHWQRRRKNCKREIDKNAVESWADELIKLEGTNAIVTPVRLEFFAGTNSKSDLALAESYLAKFTVIDNGLITKDDSQEAERLAKRIPKDGKPRHLGDCLIRAIARRLKYDITTSDKTFPK
jgi:predicted nucleic acid-binding protein